MGGIERIIERLCRELKKKNDVDEVGLLTSYNQYPKGIMKNLPRTEVMDGVTVYRCNFFPRNIPFVTNVRNSGFISYGLKEVMSEFDPDVVHFMKDGWYISNLLVYLLTRKSSRHVYSLFYHDIPESLFSKPMIWTNSYLTNNVDLVHVNSEIEKEKVHRIYKTSYDKFKVIPQGVDIPERVPEKESEYVNILCVGRLQFTKGQYELVQIYNKLQSSTKVGTKLILVGGDGGDRSKIELFVKGNRLSRKVEIIDFISDLEKLREFYEKADIFVLPTRYESFGLANVEAMAYKIPVVTYAVGAIPEVLKRGAALIEPFDKDAMAKTLLTLIEDENLRKKLGEEAYDYVRKNYSWSKTVDRFYDLYTEILN